MRKELGRGARRAPVALRALGAGTAESPVPAAFGHEERGGERSQSPGPPVGGVVHEHGQHEEDDRGQQEDQTQAERHAGAPFELTPPSSASGVASPATGSPAPRDPRPRDAGAIRASAAGTSSARPTSPSRSEGSPS